MFKRIFLIFILSFLKISSLHAVDLQFNIFKNAGFESGTADWDPAGSGISLSDDSFTGSHALQYTTGGIGQTTDMLPSIDANKTYTLTGQYKNIGIVDGMWIGLAYLDENWQSIGEKSISLQNSSVYTTFELVDIPPVGTQYISFWTWSDSTLGGKTFLDDLRLYPDGFEVTPCNILQNPDFEENTESWSVYSAQTRLVHDAYTGNRALKIKDGGMDQITQQLSDNIDTYQFYGYYKTNGSPDGTWAGMNFYDNEYNLLFSKTVTLEESQNYQKFVVNATSTKDTVHIQAWVWSESGTAGGKIILDGLKMSTSGCYNYVVPSSLPPKGIAISKAPQFVVIGFDDNTISEGIEWAANIFKDKRNSDGSDARVSFYMNTLGLDVWVQDEPQNLLQAMMELKESGHEIANHTYDHHKDLNAKAIRELNITQWNQSIQLGHQKIVNNIGITDGNITGFRAPYLLYNQNMLTALQDLNYSYDCSIEEGYAPEHNGTNFRWPYQLNAGSPGHNESWYGNPQNSEYVEITPVAGLWELPNHVLMIPKNSECPKYGIQSGLWERILQKAPYLIDYKITGFDYNLWSVVALNKEEVLGILKYNLDLRLQGNRAPFMIGAHSQFYTDNWSIPNAPNATTSQMREAISEFVTYALSKPEVRIRPARDIVNWCENPIPLD